MLATLIWVMAVFPPRFLFSTLHSGCHSNSLVFSVAHYTTSIVCSYTSFKIYDPYNFERLPVPVFAFFQLCSLLL